MKYQEAFVKYNKQITIKSDTTIGIINICDITSSIIYQYIEKTSI